MLLIKNGHIRTMAGPDIENGCILLGDDGKIASVGSNISAPDGTQVIDAQGRLVTPGCVEAHCHLGLSNPQPETGEHNEKSDPITPQMRAIDGFHPDHDQLKIAVQSGVTTVCTGPGIAKEFDLRMTIDHCTEGHLITNELAQERFPALVGSAFYVPKKSEVKNKSFATPAALHNAGVSVSIITDASVTPIRYLPLCAGLAVSEGFPLEEGWKAITINPATHTGIADRVGSLEPGKDGDVVIWTADPLLHIGGKAYTTIIKGKVEWQA